MKNLIFITLIFIFFTYSCQSKDTLNCRNTSAESTDTTTFIDPFDMQGDYTALDSIYNYLDSMTKVIYGPEATLEDVKAGKYSKNANSFDASPSKKALVVLREDTPWYKKLR